MADKCVGIAAGCWAGQGWHSDYQAMPIHQTYCAVRLILWYTIVALLKACLERIIASILSMSSKQILIN